MTPLVFGLLLVGGVGAAVYSYLQDSKRKQALAAFAASNRWTYVGEDDSLAIRWNGTPFGQGDRRRACDVLGGTSHGRAFTAFDYQYDTETTDGKGNRQRTTHHYSVVVVRLPTWLPGVQVTPDNFLMRAASAVGIGTGIELESEDFNRHFKVTAHDPKFASDVLSPRTMEGLLRSEPLAWRIEGQDLVSWDSGRLQPVAVLARLATISGVVDGIPEFVWHDNGYDPNTGQTFDPTAAAAPAPAPAPPPAPAAPSAPAPAAAPAPPWEGSSS